LLDPLYDQIVPVMGIFMIIALVLGPIWISAYFKARDRAQLHETLRIAYEKGFSPPPELVEKLTSDVGRLPSDGAVDRDLRRAIVLIAVGVGLMGLGALLGFGIGFASPTGGAVAGGAIAGAGAIPGFIGVAYLILWMVGRRR
jgi:hypothetical protein